MHEKSLELQIKISQSWLQNLLIMKSGSRVTKDVVIITEELIIVRSGLYFHLPATVQPHEQA